jgi:sigma-B regulation protein RsbU (phosphoserine phosphatase)
LHGLSVPLYQQSPGEITRESLVKILEIMHRLAAPEAMPELLREIIEVGKVAIVAEGGILWLHDRVSRDLVMVAPANVPPPRLPLGAGVAGDCVARRRIVNISECRDDARFRASPVSLPGFETRSLLSVPIVGKEEVLGVMQWLGAAPRQFDRHDEWIGPALAAEAAIAVQHSYMTDELLAHAILEKEVAVAREIQVSTLPRGLPRVDGYDLWAHFRPTDHTGGDLYDVVMLGRRVFLLLGDATGHGFGPALSATQMQAMLRVAFRLGADLDRAYVEVNNQLAEDLPDDRFITAFVGFLDPVLHTVDFHSGGQGPILHFRAAAGECDWYKPTTFPMGALPMIAAPPRQRLRLAGGDLLALVSDGIYESMDEQGRQFGEERVAAVVRAHAEAPMRELGQRLVDETFRFTGDIPQKDDITLVLVRRLPGQ